MSTQKVHLCAVDLEDQKVRLCAVWMGRKIVSFWSTKNRFFLGLKIAVLFRSEKVPQKAP